MLQYLSALFFCLFVSLFFLQPNILLAGDIVTSKEKMAIQTSQVDLLIKLESNSLDDILSGFDEIEGVPAKDSDNTDEVFSRNIDVWGRVKLSAAYNYSEPHSQITGQDFSGLSQLKAKLLLSLETDRLPGDSLFHLDGYGYYDFIYNIDSDFSRGETDELEKEIELRELFIKTNLSNKWSVTVGRQILAQGRADFLRVTDQLNPIDAREPGVIELTELRLPVTTARVDYFIGDWKISGLAIPELRFDKLPPFGSPFFAQSVPTPVINNPSNKLSNTEYAFSVDGVFSGWDISVYWARIYDEQLYKKRMQKNKFELFRELMTMQGLAASIALGNWLLNGEIAYFDRPCNPSSCDSSTSTDSSKTDGLVGIVYSGFTDTMITIEVAYRDQLPQNQSSTYEGILSFRNSFLHERLSMNIAQYFLGDDGGGFTRTKVQYEIKKNIILETQLVIYHSGEIVPFNLYKDNDRFLIGLNYDF